MKNKQKIKNNAFLFRDVEAEKVSSKRGRNPSDSDYEDEVNEKQPPKRKRTKSPGK